MFYSIFRGIFRKIGGPLGEHWGEGLESHYFTFEKHDFTFGSRDVTQKRRYSTVLLVDFVFLERGL